MCLGETFDGGKPKCFCHSHTIIYGIAHYPGKYRDTKTLQSQYSRDSTVTVVKLSSK